jgi:hypothetical protein
MNVELNETTVRDLTEGYQDNEEAGVVAYSGQLDVRPPYQREFIYNDRQRDAVINTITRGFPLNVMYWAVRDGGDYEIIDGQQRTISICQYVEGDFAFEGRYFHNLQDDERELILDYELMVYVCSGTDSEKLEWFKTVNIAGEKLTDQELRNAVYAGSWVSDAKRYFSRNNCVAYGLGSNYVKGAPIRQDYLETVIKWINGGEIEDYMGRHQHDPNANELWLYFQQVINWVVATFPVYRREMKGVEWGTLYNQFGDTPWDSADLEQKVSTLMADEDVTKKSGIYLYVLDGQERHLNIRAFSENQKREAYERQEGICPLCDPPAAFEFEEMEGDHIEPWHAGGRTEAANCRMLCVPHNRELGGV